MLPRLISRLSPLLIIAGHPLMTRGRGNPGSNSRRVETELFPSHFCKATAHAFNHFTVNIGPWCLYIFRRNCIKLFAITSLSRIRPVRSKLRKIILAKAEVSLENVLFSTGSIEVGNTYLSLKFKINFILFI